MGAGIAGFICFLLNSILGLVVIAIIISAILSWLFAFDVINYRNRFVVQVADVLDRITAPFLSPLRRIIPAMGGIDITPIIALLIIQGIRGYLLPPACMALANLLSGTL